MLGDLRARLAHARACGVTGGLFRAEWERVNDWWVLESPNAINMIGAAMLTRDPATPDQAIYAAWLAARGLPESAASWLRAMLSETWPIIERALYIDGFVFADCSMFPRSIGRAWWTMEKKHSLVDWAPERAGGLSLDGPRIAALLAEKAEAHSRACALAARSTLPDPAVPETLRREIADALALLPLYTEGMALAAEVCLRDAWARRTPAEAQRPEARDSFAAAIERLAAFAGSLAPMARETRYPHQVLMLLDHRRIGDILAEARRTLNAAAAA